LTRKLFVFGGLGFLVLFVIIPFYWIIVTCFKANLQILMSASIYFPKPFTLENLIYLFEETRFLVWLTNSFLVAGCCTIVALFAGCLAGFAVSSLEFRGNKLMSLIIMITYLVPPGLMFLPLYRVFTQFDFTNSVVTLMVAYPTFITPFCAWLMIGFFKSVPKALIEVALIDGANYLRTFFVIVLPLVAPGVLASSLFCFTLSWNEFLYALIFISDETKQTIPVGLSGFLTADVASWGTLFGASLLATIPVIVLYIYLQKYMIGGLTMGAVKG
jgi:multiple sugar transport system permease protein